MANSRKFFDDNLSLLGSTIEDRRKKDPFAYNLYCGLSNMGHQLSDIQSQLSDMQSRLTNLDARISNIESSLGA